MNLKESIEEIVSTPIETSKLVFCIHTSDKEEAVKILMDMGLNFNISTPWESFYGYYSEVCVDFGFCHKEALAEIGL